MRHVFKIRCFRKDNWILLQEEIARFTQTKLMLQIDELLDASCHKLLCRIIRYDVAALPAVGEVGGYIVVKFALILGYRKCAVMYNLVAAAVWIGCSRSHYKRSDKEQGSKTSQHLKPV